MEGMHHVQLCGGGACDACGGLALGHIELLLAMLALRELETLIQTRHADLTVGQKGLPTHDDQQRHYDHDDGQELDEPSPGTMATTGRNDLQWRRLGRTSGFAPWERGRDPARRT
jgi:hypothetical protein